MRAMLELLRQGKDIRNGMIEHLKDSIDAGEYENILKLDVAAERVVDEMGW